MATGVPKYAAIAASLLLAVVVARHLAGGTAEAQTTAMPQYTLAQSDYIEHCGGCHGIQGSSAPADIPVLRDRVGYFMCTPDARAYLLRLPNVAHSRITDNAQLADLMNFVVFGLGKGSVPSGTKPFTSDEVALERQKALTSAALTKVRTMLVNKLVRSCGAPASLRLFFPGQVVAKGSTPR
jgi:hypothetical protein